MVDETGYLERVGCLPIPSRVELEHATVVILVCAGLIGRVDVLGEDRAFGDPRLDDGDSDPERRQLLRQALAQPLERPLRCDVRRLSEGCDTAGDRSDVDDGARTSGAHSRQHLLQAANRAAQVDVHQLEVGRGLAFLGDRISTDPGIVDQYVDHTVGFFENPRKAGSHRLVVGNIKLHKADIDPGFGRHRLQLARLVDTANSAVDGMTLLGQVDSCGAADAAIGAGNDGDGHPAMVSRCD